MASTIDQLREKSLDLKIEKAELLAKTGRVNEQLARFLQPQELQAARAEKAELAADIADVDVDLSKVNAAIERLSYSERCRDHRMNNIRLLTAALLKAGASFETCVNDACKIESLIQATEPIPAIDLEIDDD